MAASIEKSFRVHVGREGASILIKEAADGPEFGFELVTTDERSKDWFGDVSLHIVDKEFAKVLVSAMMQMIDHMECK